MKMKFYIIAVLVLIFQNTFSQVGIGTTMPNSQLDIRSSNQVTPAINDGILIPKVDNLSAVPTIAQQAMLVYLTTNISANYQKGFYYWDFPTLTWIGISSTANGDKDWFEVGTTLAPDDINDNMFHLGNTAIGKNTATSKLDVETIGSDSNSIVNSFNATSDLGTNRFGINNSIFGSSNDFLSSNFNSINGTGTGIHVGVFNQINSANSAFIYGNQSTVNSNSNTFGNSNFITNNSASTGTSVFSFASNLAGTSAGSIRGVDTSIGVSGNGTHIGTNTLINNAGTGTHYGAFSTIGGTGNGLQFGNYITLTNSGGANHFGNATFMSGGTTGNKLGYAIDITNNGTGVSTGFSSNLIGSGNGNQTGLNNTFNNSGSGFQYGVFNNFTSNGIGDRFGNFNNFIGITTGLIVGSRNLISTTGNGGQYGINNILNGGGTGVHYGIYNAISGNGSGNQYGSYNDIINTGNSLQFGNYNTIANAGIGTKYGTYNIITPISGGSHYGIYSEVLKAGATNFAGYFLGNVAIGTTTLNTYTFPPSRGTLGQVLRTDGAGNVSWANNSDFSWSLNGNATVATNFIGTINTQPFRLFSNNLERMRIQPTGEVSINNIAPVASDLFTVTTSGILNYGINGYNSLPSGSAIYGTNSNTANTFSAIEGNTSSGTGAGVLGVSNGTTTGGLSPTGVVGQYSGVSNTGVRIGVRGFSGRGFGNQQIGVQGTYNPTSWGIGVVGLGAGGLIPAGNLDIGVLGWVTNTTNYSGYFNGNHVIANGTKSASVGTSKGNQLLYVTELPEVWFEDVGGGTLENGSKHIALDPLFLETIFVDDTHPMRIFLQEEGESNGLIVIKDSDNKGFIVKEKNNGNSTISFSYRIMAKRLNFQDHRFGNDPVWGQGDTRKYNQFATPPPVDYNDNIIFQENQKKTFKPSLMPEGFVKQLELQNEAKSKEVKAEVRANN